MLITEHRSSHGLLEIGKYCSKRPFTSREQRIQTPSGRCNKHGMNGRRCYPVPRKRLRLILHCLPQNQQELYGEHGHSLESLPLAVIRKSCQLS
jgi:hypothetical protein